MAISINIHGGLDERTTQVSATGYEEHVITDTETKTFHLTDSELKSAVEKYFGKKPNDAYLHSPTPWNDLYKRYDWDEVMLVLEVIGATIEGVTSEPTNLAPQQFENNSDVSATFNASISQNVSQTVSNTWSQTNSIQVGSKVTVGVQVPGVGSAGGEISTSYSYAWGESKTESTTVTVGTQSGLSVELAPGQSIDAILSASRGKIKVRVKYKAHLKGRTAINYNPTYKDHHFWGLSIANVMSSANISNELYFTEDIVVDFYANSHVELRTSEGKTLFRSSSEDEFG